MNEEYALIISKLPKAGDSLTVNGTTYFFIPRDVRVIEIQRTKAKMAAVISDATGIPVTFDPKRNRS